MRRRPHRRSVRLTPFRAAACAGVLAVAGAATTAPKVDPLVCFVDAEGRTVRIGDTVRDRFGREIGWISASQCAADAPADKLRVVPSLYGAVDPVEVDASALVRAEKDVVLALSADELDRSRQYARGETREAPS